MVRRSLAMDVRDGIRALINSSALDSGAQLPSEADLAGRFGVARTTLREAFRLLEHDGIVTTVHGRGRFVSALARLEVSRPITRFESVTEMFEAQGYSLVNQVLDVRATAATPEEADALQVAAGAPIVRLERLRLHGEEPLIYSQNAIDAALLPAAWQALDWSGSAIALLRSHGGEVVSSSAEVRAAPLPEDVTALPALAGHPAWLLIREICLLDSGKPALFAHDYHRSDVFSFHVLRKRDASTSSGSYSRSIEMALRR